jgi:hypothetical protein
MAGPDRGNAGLTGARIDSTNLGGTTEGEARVSAERAAKTVEKIRPESNWGLGVARVINLDYEEFFVSLQTITGVTQTYDRVPVPMTFPGAGARHFFGAMPELGDLCVVGWMPQESAAPNKTQTPVILSWLVPGVWVGREWVTTSELPVEEADVGTPRLQGMFGKAFPRIRHKLRHIQPGNIVASSSQGSDLVLDEGVMLANRRGNEIRLRDQDQAVVTRALQRFDALAGTRIYAGMVQRDATYLAPAMVSDGQEWDGPLQTINGNPVTDFQLPADPTSFQGFLSPARILRKKAQSAEKGYQGRTLLDLDEYLDPYVFLKNGGYINDQGYIIGDIFSDAIYGGKSFYRVANQTLSNAVLDPQAPTLTEYRIEVTHTTDGTLPVTEQTDMFDAERLPKRSDNTGDGQFPTNRPFIEWVLGSVVGNDPFSQDGKDKYGMPLVATIFDGNVPSPRIDAADIAYAGSTVSPTPVAEQLATLFHLIPPLAKSGTDTFWGVNKQGQVRASIGGDPKENSAEINLTGNMKVAVGGDLTWIIGGHQRFVTPSPHSLDLEAQQGCVRIYGGGTTDGPDATIARLSGTNQGDASLPAVDIEARTNIWVKAEKQVFLKGQTIYGNASRVDFGATDGISLNGTNQIDMTTDNLITTVNAKCQQSFAGPKYGLPTNLPLHERSYTPLLPGMTCEKIYYNLGDREEEFKFGNHTTTVYVGNMSYSLLAGTWKVQAISSTLTMDASGITGVASAGVVSLTASAGAATMTGSTSASLVATGGTANVRGSSGVYLGGPISGPDFGSILASGSLDPLTGLPFSTWGIGAKSFNIGP